MKNTSTDQKGCCPTLDPKQLCEVMHFNYRLNYRPESETFREFANFPVGIEVKFSFTYKRCPGGLLQGDLVYTNTLLPGEIVRLFTSDRRTTFTLDTSTAAANRNVQSSEESFQAQQMSDSMFDFTSKDSQNSSYTNKAHVDGHGDAGVDILGFGGEANMSGNFNSSGTSSFANELNQHAQSKQNETAMSTRKASSVSVGEVQTRAHTETSSEDHYESSSREFKNPNHCHAITFLFYQIDKSYTITFSLDAITIRVYNSQLDNARISPTPFTPSDGIGILSTHVLATDAQKFSPAADATTNAARGLFINPAFFNQEQQPLPQAVIQKVTDIVKNELVQVGLLNKDGSVSDSAQKQYGFSSSMALPTPGIMVKGCIDDCDICEDDVHQALKLDLENKQLQNQLLKRQIDLLDKSQEYRCCPEATVETE
ncbi:hypothetical protein [Mucilaginibacter sp.]|jgi:hypothetical protein|uniref:hypothetical protein n=1 Tax=Mucilaginibacter sp. TaxID=1882438 RepID=UPI00260AF15E|nr:hypothetical protein [Mucilaginibacter sp.]MDB4919538.1 hypothetical protein [Mucilaginibacter sp.]